MSKQFLDLSVGLFLVAATWLAVCVGSLVADLKARSLVRFDAISRSVDPLVGQRVDAAQARADAAKKVFEYRD